MRSCSTGPAGSRWPWRKKGIDLRQSYTRVGKFAPMKQQRYAHAKQFKRAGKALRKLRTYLGRTIRDIGRQIAGDEQLQDIFRHPRTWRAGFSFSARSRWQRRACPRRDPGSTACMLRKWNALERARRTSLTSSASRSPLPPRCTAQRAASSRSMRRRCRGNPMTGTRWRP